MARVISKINGLAVATLSKISGATLASISKVNGLDFTAAAGPTYLLEENFESGSAPTGWTIGGDWVWNSQTTPALQGTYCATSQSWSTPDAYKEFTAAGEVWWYMMYRVADSTTSDTTVVGLVAQTGGTAIGTCYMNTSGQLACYWEDYSATTNTVAVIPNATKVHIFGHFKKHASAAVLEIGFTTDGTYPTGDNLATLSAGAYNVNCGRITIAGYAGNNVATYFDRFLVDDVAIVPNP